jgi:hypothetical protein
MLTYFRSPLRMSCIWVRINISNVTLNFFNSLEPNIKLIILATPNICKGIWDSFLLTMVLISILLFFLITHLAVFIILLYENVRAVLLINLMKRGEWRRLSNTEHCCIWELFWVIYVCALVFQVSILLWIGWIHERICKAWTLSNFSVHRIKKERTSYIIASMNRCVLYSISAMRASCTTTNPCIPTSICDPEILST